MTFRQRAFNKLSTSLHSQRGVPNLYNSGLLSKTYSIDTTSLVDQTLEHNSIETKTDPQTDSQTDPQTCIEAI